MSIDVTDATFESDVLNASNEQPIVVDLWAPWCGPCRTLGPILESVVGTTEGAVKLVKVNVDENPSTAASFQVQSIPAVFAVTHGKVVDGFIGAISQREVEEFVAKLLTPKSAADELSKAGDEDSLRRALEIEPDHVAAISALATLLVARGDDVEALELLARIPETDQTRHLSALARLGVANADALNALTDGSIDARLTALLERVKNDDAARQEFLDLLDAMEPEDARKNQYRRALASRIF